MANYNDPAPTSSNTRIDVSLNRNTKTDYRLSANAVELMEEIGEQDGKIKLTTKVNSNLVIGDYVYLCTISGDSSGYTDFSYVLDNVIEVSGCTDWWYNPYVQGYKVVNLYNKKNEVVIDRIFDEKLRNKSIYRHYLTKIYVEDQYFKKGLIDCVVFKNVILNEQVSATTITNDIDIHQAIILSGVTKYIEFKDKYDDLYVTLNSQRLLESKTTTSDSIYSYFYTNNNDKYGYSIIRDQHISGSTIDNGYFYDCVIVNCDINYGSFIDCIITGSTINNGYFSGSTIHSTNTWLYGTWDEGTFDLPTFNDGIWNSGEFVNKTWIYGIFNNGIFSGSTWVDGLFNGGNMIVSDWSGGTFNNGSAAYIDWSGGTFNNGTISFSDWYDGYFMNGEISESLWSNGEFRGGKILSNTIWYDGTFFNGDFRNSIWSGGTWNNGVMRNSHWYIGTFNQGYMIETSWYDGIFNNGTFDSRLTGLTYTSGMIQDDVLPKWVYGTFNGGNFVSSYWINGVFTNGVVTDSIIRQVNWLGGVFNGNQMGPQYNAGWGSDFVVNWSGGTWNGGVFGAPVEFMSTPPGSHVYMNWLTGDFFDGEFHNSGFTFGSARYYWGGWSGGTFYNGSFYGDFFDGDWVQGNFIGTVEQWHKNSRPPHNTSRNVKYTPFTHTD